MSMRHGCRGWSCFTIGPRGCQSAQCLLSLSTLGQSVLRTETEYKVLRTEHGDIEREASVSVVDIASSQLIQAVNAAPEVVMKQSRCRKPGHGRNAPNVPVCATFSVRNPNPRFNEDPSSASCCRNSKLQRKRASNQSQPISQPLCRVLALSGTFVGMATGKY
jgi:hypothetical protein